MSIQSDEELAALPEHSPLGPSSPEDLRRRCEFILEMVIRDMGGVVPEDSVEPGYWEDLAKRLNLD